jgi:putative membrane protein
LIEFFFAEMNPANLASYNGRRFVMRAITFFAAVVLASAASVGTSDSTFVTKAAQAGSAEVKLGQLAQDKGSNQAVKDFGAQMVKDHTDAGNELKTTASGKGLSVPDSPNAKQQATYDRLSKLSGAQFDRAYASAMVKDHVEAVAEFRKESQSGQDSDIKAFAAKTLPTLEHHLEMAKDMEKKVGAASAK